MRVACERRGPAAGGIEALAKGQGVAATNSSAAGGGVLGGGGAVSEASDSRSESAPRENGGPAPSNKREERVQRKEGMWGSGMMTLSCNEGSRDRTEAAADEEVWDARLEADTAP